MKREHQPCGTVAAYQRHLIYGQVPDEECLAAVRERDRIRRATTERRTCDSCGESFRAATGRRGWCRTCYQRWYRAGCPDEGPPPSRRAQYDRLRDRDGLNPVEAAERLGINLATAARHEKRRALAGLPSERVPRPMYMVTCTNCGERGEHRGHGWCRRCYLRWYVAGKPFTGPPPSRRTSPGGATADAPALKAVQPAGSNPAPGTDHNRESRNGRWTTP